MAATQASLKKTSSNGNGFMAKNIYQESFPFRVEDYSEIFSSYNNNNNHNGNSSSSSSSSSRSTSIPFLDLPVVDDEGGVESCSKFDYLEIFGGFDSVDYAVPYEELFVEPKVAAIAGESSEEEVWTPAETGSPSEDSSEDPVSLESSRACSNVESHCAYDGVKQFNVSYHKTNQISKEDGISGTTHIAQLNAVPAFTFVVDEDLPLQTANCDNPLPEVANDHNLNGNITDWKMDGEHFWETTPAQPACGSDQKPQRNLDGNGSYKEKPFVTVTEISLRTQPSEVPPPSRPPPMLSIGQGSHKIRPPNLKSTAHYARQGAASDSPHFFDVEVDLSSSAAASAAAMKEAMEKAQARLKSAKELMERKKGGLQHRKKVGMKDDSKEKERREGGIAHDLARVKEENSHTKLEKDSELRAFDKEEKQKGVGLAQITPELEVKSRSFNVSKESVDLKHMKEHRLTDESQREEIIGEWKAEEQFYELVKKDTVGTVLAAPEHKKSERNSRATTRVYEQEQNEKKAEKVAFVQQGKRACELEEDKKRVNVTKEAYERAEHEEKMKEAQNICDQEEHEKRQKEARVLKESEKKLKEVREQEDHEKKLKETREQEQQEARKQEEYGKKLKEAEEREELEKKLKEAEEQEELEKKLKESREREENEKRKKEALQIKENERRQREAREKEESAKKQEACEREENERRQKEAREKEENEKRIMERKQNEARQWEENERRQKEAREREENEKILKESHERRQRETREREENERRQKEAREKEENEKRINEEKQKEARQREENKRIQIEACEREEYAKKLRESYERQENDRKVREAVEENERILRVAREREENERRQKDREREENIKKLKESNVAEENERKLRQVAEENEKIQKESHDQEENQKRLKEPCEEEVTEKLLETETCKRVENEQKVMVPQERNESEMRPEESCKRGNNDKKLKKATDQEEINKRHNEAFEREVNNEHELSQNFHVCIEKEKNLTGKTVFEVVECEKKLKAGCDQEKNNKKMKMAQESCKNEDYETTTRIVQYAYENRENVKNLGEDEVSSEQYENERLRAAPVAQSSLEHEECEGNQITASSAKVDDSEKKSGNIEDVAKREKDQKFTKEDLVALDCKDRKKSVKSSQRVGQCVEDGMKIEVVQQRTAEEKRTKPKSADELSTNQERKEKNVNGTAPREESGKEGRTIKEREQEKERLRKSEEDRLREKEREKDRMAVEKVTREARERAYADACERAERAAVERATAEARQRAMAEARERLEKACAEAREKSLAEKAYTEARLRAERAAVERATAEARERAVEKAMAERAAIEARERVERSVSEKFSATSRDSGLRHTASFSDLRDAQFQSSSSFSSSQRYPSSLNHGAYAAEKSQETEVESAQRCKAKLERHQRTVERAAKALAEKNLRDHLAQREQAERNRLAETLDADVKRWSSGKEGNLRALLSTLQYILGSESGWQPIPLTEVITAVAVKKAYRKATLCVHPDKLQQRGASIPQKYICEKVFDLLKDAWNKFNSEER